MLSGHLQQSKRENRQYIDKIFGYYFPIEDDLSMIISNKVKMSVA